MCRAVIINNDILLVRNVSPEPCNNLVGPCVKVMLSVPLLLLWTMWTFYFEWFLVSYHKVLSYCWVWSTLVINGQQFSQCYMVNLLQTDFLILQEGYYTKPVRYTVMPCQYSISLIKDN